VLSATNVSVAKLTKEEKKVEEDVDNWSKERAETLAKANRKISDRMMTSAFASFRDWDPFSRGSGLWFYNRDARCYTFLPFYYGWGSPYGNSYSTSIYSPYFGAYPARGNHGWPQSGNGNGSTGSNGNGGGTSSGGSSSGGYTRPSRPVDAPVHRMPSPSSGGRIQRKTVDQ